MGRKPTKQPSFFKILLDDFATHLCIPPKFAKNHIRPSLLGKCVLKGPCGNRTVEIQRRKNGLFFHNHGWRNFVKDHHLQRGDFLMFRYDGKSKFKVKIYDRTCCEIDVEAPKRKNGIPTIPSENEGKRFSWVKDEIVDVDSDTENENGYVSGKNRKLENGEKSSTRSIVFKSDYSCFKAIISRHSRHRLVIPKKLAKAKGLESRKSILIEDPNGKMWPVKIVMVDSSVGISTSWSQCRKANDIVVGDTVVFEFVEDGVMRLHVVSKGVGRKGGHKRPISVVLDAPNIDNGFRKHSWEDDEIVYGQELIISDTENGLDEIDVEASKRENGIRTIPSENEGKRFSWVKDEIDDVDSDTKNENDYISGKNRKLENGEKSIVFKSEYSCFKATISRYGRYRLVIPKELATEKGLESKKTIAVEDPNGKMWPVNIVMVTSSVLISTSWGQCRKANNIVVGDTVVFEFVEDGMMRLHVVSKGLGRTGGHNNRPISVVLDAPNIAPTKKEGHQLSWEEDEIVYENGYISGKDRKIENGRKPSTRPVVFKSENPCFLQIITKYARYRVIIPKDLAVAKGLESKESIVVEDSNGKMWPVKIVMVYSSVAISTGWVECCKANKIVKGRIVVFEFVEDAVMRVHVVSKGTGKRGGHNRVVLDAPNINKKS